MMMIDDNHNSSNNAGAAADNDNMTVDLIYIAWFGICSFLTALFSVV